MSLIDLPSKFNEIRALVDAIEFADVQLPKEFREAFVKYISENTAGGYSGVEWADYSAKILTSTGRSIYLPNYWFYLASELSGLFGGLIEQKSLFGKIFKGGDLNLIAKDLRDNSGEENKLIIKSYFRSNDYSNEDYTKFVKYVSDYATWGGGKTIDRGDFFISPLMKAGNLLAETQGAVAEIAECFYKSPELLETFTPLFVHPQPVPSQDEISTVLTNSTIRIFAYDVFKYLFDQGMEESLFQLLRKAEGNEGRVYSELVLDDRKIYRLFRVANSELENQELMSGEKIRFFLPPFEFENKYYYLTNQWADNSGNSKNSRDIMSLSVIFNHIYKNLKIIKENDIYKLLKSFSKPNSYGASNIIYYGAPGTGKSYAIDEIVKASRHVSTVFHPDTQYSDFVGCLKPSMNGSDVEYKFREGPFCKVLKVAHENPQEHCYLVIEEINRASAAAVFGEIFQLLDRESNGGSRYGVDINDPDMLSYLATNAPSVIIDGQLKLPSNLSIYATMNSSDQAVMPMDTAFKRRWRFEYKPINFDKCANGSFTILDSESLPFTISWKKFAGCINECLAMQEIPEDRHLGPWFLSSEELQDEKCASYALTGKLFMYLWDDVLRHGLKTTIFDSNIKNYGQLVHSFNSGVSVFSQTLLDRFQEAISVSMSLVAEPTSEYRVSKNSQEE